MIFEFGPSIFQYVSSPARTGFSLTFNALAPLEKELSVNDASYSENSFEMHFFFFLQKCSNISTFPLYLFYLSNFVCYPLLILIFCESIVVFTVALGICNVNHRNNI